MVFATVSWLIDEASTLYNLACPVDEPIIWIDNEITPRYYTMIPHLDTEYCNPPQRKSGGADLAPSDIFGPVFNGKYWLSKHYTLA